MLYYFFQCLVITGGVAAQPAPAGVVMTVHKAVDPLRSLEDELDDLWPRRGDDGVVYSRRITDYL